MRTFSASYVPGVLFATPALGRAAMATAWRWRRLLALLFDPYRPEQHYMRGPGPKWREKHARYDAGALAPQRVLGDGETTYHQATRGLACGLAEGCGCGMTKLCAIAFLPRGLRS
jgi:hypothetical protein